jgi:hypothetical protein
MGLFGGKPKHARSVELLVENAVRLWRAEQPEGYPADLQLEDPDSQFRFLVFCMSAVHYACASRMPNPDAVLNEAVRHLVALALSDTDTFFGGAVTPQDAANRTAIIQDFLNRWSAYKDIREGGNPAAATGIIAGMLKEVESPTPATQDDSERLVSLAKSVESLLKLARERFK